MPGTAWGLEPVRTIWNIAILAVVAVAVSSGVEAAKLYKCVNAGGETTYKQSPCVDDKQQKVLEHKSAAERRKETDDKRRREMQEQQMARRKKNNEEARARAEQHRARLQDSRRNRIEAAIAGGYTVTGMSKEEVRLALGSPTSISLPRGSSMGRVTELWVYKARKKTDYVHFEDGRVVSKSGHEQ